MSASSSRRHLPLQKGGGGGGGTQLKSTRDFLATKKIGDERENSDSTVDDDDVQRPTGGYTPITVQSINDPTNQIRRTVYVTIKGTMGEFGQKRPSQMLFHHADAISYTTSRARPGEPDDFGDVRRGFITKAKVITSSNTFPCDVLWASKKLPGENVISTTELASPQKGFFLAPAATRGYKTSKHEGRIRCRQPISGEFLQKYAHALPGIQEIGIQPLPGNKWFVPRGNPLEHLLFANKRNGYEIDRGEFNDVRGIIVELEPLNNAREIYKSTVLPNVPLVDMLDINLNLHRAGVKWSDPLDDMPTETLSIVYTATIQIEMTYRLMFTREIPASQN